jgi:hypothetical protein
MKLLTAVLTVLLFAPATGRAQTTAMSTADVQRLEEEIKNAGTELAKLSNASPALRTELEELREEVIYLKVKVRREGNVPRSEYHATRDRIDAFLGKVRGGTGARTGAPATGASTPSQPSGRTDSSAGVIPVGQEIDVRLQTRLSSETAQVEDRFEATTMVDLSQGERVLIPAGSVLRGIVRSVDPATRTDRRGEMTVSFDQVTIRGRAYPMRGTVTEALKSGIKGDATRIGAGAGVGAIIGGIIGGAQGALLGVLIGGGGTIAATPGKDVVLEPGTVLRVRMDTPPEIR